MANGTFEAFWLPAFGTRFAEHTYVEVDGQPFGCHGRSAGGTSVCAGTGDGSFGVCLAVNGNAGIRYGVTGVCHQAANRVLLPAGLTVANVQSFRQSILAFGTYGRSFPFGGADFDPVSNRWPELQSCRTKLGIP